MVQLCSKYLWHRLRNLFSLHSTACNFVLDQFLQLTKLQIDNERQCIIMILLYVLQFFKPSAENINKIQARFDDFALRQGVSHFFFKITSLTAYERRPRLWQRWSPSRTPRRHHEGLYIVLERSGGRTHKAQWLRQNLARIFASFAVCFKTVVCTKYDKITTMHSNFLRISNFLSYRNDCKHYKQLSINRTVTH